MSDDVNHPPHYNNHPSGVECIQVTEHHDFCIGNVIKYCWRAGLKAEGASEMKDLQKARWYLDRKIAKLEGAKEEKKEREVGFFEREAGELYGSTHTKPAFYDPLTKFPTEEKPPSRKALVCYSCGVLVTAGTTQHNCIALQENYGEPHLPIG